MGSSGPSGDVHACAHKCTILGIYVGNLRLHRLRDVGGQVLPSVELPKDHTTTNTQLGAQRCLAARKDEKIRSTRGEKSGPPLKNELETLKI